MSNSEGDFSGSSQEFQDDDYAGSGSEDEYVSKAAPRKRRAEASEAKAPAKKAPAKRAPAKKAAAATTEKKAPIKRTPTKRKLPGSEGPLAAAFAAAAKKTASSKNSNNDDDEGSAFEDNEPVAAPKKRRVTATKKASTDDDGSAFEDDEEDDFAPAPKKTAAKPKVTKKAAAPKATKASVAESAPSELTDSQDSVTEEANSSKTIEEIYQKKSQLEHILLRPDTYVGSIEAEEQEMYVFDSEADNIVKRKIKYVPGLYKIIDEILVNAADNKIRDPDMTMIKVIIDREQNFISIYNNGKGVPITIHKTENCYVPELIFGHLLTSSNYNDKEKKVTGGRNGFGAKLCNIFSTEFTVETADKERGLKYHQVFKNNMTVIGKPKILSNSSGTEFTRISFKPDLSKFGMTELDDDFEALIKKRVYDLAGICRGVQVHLNGVRIPIKTFQSYCDLYTNTLEFRPAEGKKPIIYEGIDNPRWTVGFAVSDGQFHQVSFVNSICTAKGGTHVNHVADQIVKYLLPEVQKKSQNKSLRPFHIKSHITLFINCLIENPAFDSQTKENMTLRASSFGSSFKPSDKFLKAISQSGIVNNIVRFIKFKEDEKMSKADTGKMARRLKIPKLEDANLAGVKPHNKSCTLILTEGDSAKALVLSGLSVVGRDKFGVFPLRGKVLNVRDATNTQIMNNAEITNIKAILGLKHGKVYTSVDELRYGKLMLMTDQDHDGSHIKGLLINFLDSMFPSLLQIPGFLLEFITPIIRCKHKRTKEEVSFFTIPEYEVWAEANNKNSDWVPKYFKGLGTSDKSDARKYFSQPEVHMKEFETPNEDERGLVDMAFNKNRAADRKNWLATYEPGIFIDHNVSKIKFTDFFNRELMLFSMADNIRSIPSVVDGFKPGQRKVFFGAIKRGKNTEVKVAQFANYVAGLTQYHHGEASVAATVINMAQDFVGSNNINLLVPAGQFGTRHEGGKSAASPRYLFTKMAKLARLVYHPDDDNLLEYLIEENKPIEPKWYIPILPMVLVNGADGIGTGWSTTIPNYNPEDLVNNIFRLMDEEEMVPMQPWFRGFKGEIAPAGPGKYTCNGIAELMDDSRIKVTELPVRLWTDTFKENLELMREPKEKKPLVNIIDFSNNSTDSNVEFTIEIDDKNLNAAQDMGINKALKIVNNISVNNIVCFDKDGKIRKYESPEQILKEFYELRLEYYIKRKAYLIEVLQDEFDRLDNKAKFIDLVIKKELIYINRKEEEVVAEMKKHGLKQIFPRKKSALIVDEDDDSQPAEEGTGYEYLFSISVRGFTAQKVVEAKQQRDKKFVDLQKIKETPPKTFWRNDLNALLVGWKELLQEDEKLAKEGKPLKKGSAAAAKRKRVIKK